MIVVTTETISGKNLQTLGFVTPRCLDISTDLAYPFFL